MSTTDKPVLFLDVDGVLNSFGKSPWDLTVAHNVFYAPHGMAYKIRTSTLIGKALMELDIEIRWLTTWRDDAPTHIAELAGLPRDLDVAFTHEQYDELLNNEDPFALDWGSGTPWKLRTVLSFIREEQGRPFIWADDAAVPKDAKALATEVDFEGFDIPPHLLIRPDGDIGLTPEHIQEMREFLDSLPKSKDLP